MRFSDFALRSASGESGAEDGEKPERNVAPSADGSVSLMRFSWIQIVTSTRFARGREGKRADRKCVERANRVLVTVCEPEFYLHFSCGIIY